MEVDKLVWNRYSGVDEDNRRLLQVAESPETLEQFLDQLMTNSWTDKFVEQSELSQDIRRGRPNQHCIDNIATLLLNKRLSDEKKAT
ncbi:MAG: hypothetical protein R3D26_13110 [Cyanobacteriota/Melainabacteria group bacterium]